MLVLLVALVVGLCAWLAAHDAGTPRQMRSTALRSNFELGMITRKAGFGSWLSVVASVAGFMPR